MPVLLCNENEFKYFGLDKLLRTLIDDLRNLQLNGFEIAGVQQPVKGTLNLLPEIILVHIVLVDLWKTLVVLYVGVGGAPLQVQNFIKTHVLCWTHSKFRQ